MNEAAYRGPPGCCRDTLDSFRQSPFLEAVGVPSPTNLTIPSARRGPAERPRRQPHAGQRRANGAYAAEHGDISR
jgi:hypothetical protein